MIKIIKKGEEKTKYDKMMEKKYITKCHNCKCKYVYQTEDITADWDGGHTICPQCDNLVPIPLFPRRYREKNEKICN